MKLVPVLFIFACVCVTYGVLGHELYGHEMFHFRDLPESMSTLALMILGDNLELYYDSKLAHSLIAHKEMFLRVLCCVMFPVVLCSPVVKRFLWFSSSSVQPCVQ